MSTAFRWGIVGTGNIARQFARDLAALPDHALVAVASRTQERATAFCAEFGGAASASEAAMLARDDVDAVYVSTPNALHAEPTIRTLRSGKHVLCEKPMAVSLSEAERMFAAADQAGRTLIEAFMYRCHPQTRAIADAVRRGEIGRLTHVRTSFVFHVRNVANNIRFDPALAGGALMDIGCYCLDFSRLLADAPLKTLHAVRRMHESGVDILTSGVMEYDNGVQATFTCGMDAQGDNSAIISGSEGYIAVGWPWKPSNETAGFAIHKGIPPRQDLQPGQQAVAPPPRRVEARADLPLYALEARAFAAACRGEAPPFMSRDDSLANAQALAAAASVTAGRRP